jgi:hypothetical protein
LDHAFSTFPGGFGGCGERTIGAVGANRLATIDAPRFRYGERRGQCLLVTTGRYAFSPKFPYDVNSEVLRSLVDSNESAVNVGNLSSADSRGRVQTTIQNEEITPSGS